MHTFKLLGFSVNGSDLHCRTSKDSICLHIAKLLYLMCIVGAKGLGRAMTFAASDSSHDDVQGVHKQWSLELMEDEEKGEESTEHSPTHSPKASESKEAEAVLESSADVLVSAQSSLDRGLR